LLLVSNRPSMSRMAGLEQGWADSPQTTTTAQSASNETRLPPVWRDPWAGLVVLCVGAVLFAVRGVPLGEPAADDFDFLNERTFKPLDWFGGAGSPLYWRPLSRQLYYLIITPFSVAHPALVAGLQACLLAAAGVALYRALRPAWPAHAAAAAAAFPLALEASVQVVNWSSGAQDLLALLFGVLGLLALSRARPVWAIVCLACALLSKETAIAFAAAMPLWPALKSRPDQPPGARQRLRLAGMTAVTLAIWWPIHEWAMRRAGQLPAPGGEGGRLEQLGWAANRVWREALNAGDAGAPLSPWMPAAVVLVVAIAIAVAARSPSGRGRLRASLPWLAWAAVWSGLAVLPIAWFRPSWGSFRAVIPVVGIGIALVALLRSAGGWAVATMSAMRLAALLLVPPVPARVPITLEGWNLQFDRKALGSLQRFTREVRTVATGAHPTLTRAARIVPFQWPRMSSAVFADVKAFRVWYRDSSVRVIGMIEAQADPGRMVDLAIDFEPRRSPQVALIAPAAMRSLLLAADSLRLGRAAAALSLLDDLERQQADTSAAVFLASGSSLRGAALLELRRDDEAGTALARAVQLNPDDMNAHRLLAELHRRNGRPHLAAQELQRHLGLMPDDAAARRELETLLGEAR
jgi:hypothetical protein